MEIFNGFNPLCELLAELGYSLNLDDQFCFLDQQRALS